MNNKNRNYSFLHKKESSLDTVEIENNEYVIPATPGTTYWAILKFFYENPNRYISPSEAVKSIREILEDRDPDKWDRFKNKSNIKTFKEGKIITKEASPWNERLENNIKTLTRIGGNNKYGQRLIERGHILEWNSKILNNGGYILRTDTNKPSVNKKLSKTN